MAETSGLWTTAGTPVGHQVTSYTQAVASDMLAISSSCSGFEGVAPGYLNELAPSTPGTTVCRVATGAAMVDGKFYKNTANVDLTIPAAAGGGNTRIDLAVIRATWGTVYTATAAVVSGTAAATPGTPAVTQNSGTLYEIPIARCLVDTSGSVTVTDTRKWAIVDTDESTIEDNAGLLRVKDGGINTTQVANNAIDDTKVGNRVPQFYRRQGGGATNWNTTGTASYTPTTIRMQSGALSVGTSGVGTVTFPQAFSDEPVVFAQNGVTSSVYIAVTSITSTTCQLRPFDQDGNTSSCSSVYWFAVGPE